MWLNRVRTIHHTGIGWLKEEVLPMGSGKKRKRKMLQAAGIGAVAGGGIGYYMDSQEAKLRKTLRASGVSVERDGESM